MTESEAVEKLKAYAKCQSLQVKGIYEDCNNKICDNCDLCYMQGTTGEHREAIDIAIQALEKQIAMKPIRHTELEDFKCPACGSTEIRPYDTEYREYDKDYKFEYCSDCCQKLDWS